MLKRFTILLLIFAALVTPAAAQASFERKVIACHLTKRSDESRICRRVTPPDFYESVLYGEKLELTTVRIDLNRDGRKELLVWESSWAGTSGGALWILSFHGRRLKQLVEIDSVWSPIILLKSRHHRWSDFAYYQSGGGLKEMFVFVRHDGKKYAAADSTTNPPKGTVLIGKDWNRSVFGPLK